jgi:uncharacterized membrane protein
MFQNLKKKIKNYFLSGLLVVVPLGITFIVIRALFLFLDNLLLPYLVPYVGEWLRIPGLGILITIMTILLFGIIGTNFIGRRFVSLGERMLLRIPIAKSVYGSVKQIVETFSFNQETGNQKVVMVEYPRKGVWSIGLINGKSHHPETREPLYNLLIVAAINPASGFFILVPQSEVVHLNISIEEAMRWIVSGGIVSPKNLKMVDGTRKQDQTDNPGSAKPPLRDHPVE